jgi:hypothetical protein
VMFAVAFWCWTPHLRGEEFITTLVLNDTRAEQLNLILEVTDAITIADRRVDAVHPEVVG